jgi:ATP-dependent DNA helicase RecQ
VKAGKPANAAATEEDSWEGVDQGLFDALRQLRRDEAVSRAVPAYIVFGDRTLRDLARRRPSTVERMLDVHGIGRQKAADFGQQFVEFIVGYCRQYGLAMDVQSEVASSKRPATPSILSGPPAAAIKSFPLFDERLTVEEVAARLGRALSTTYGYLDAYVRHRRVIDPVPWVTPVEFAEIAAAAERLSELRLKPIHEALGGRIGYERIRIAMVCLANQTAADGATQVSS